MRATDRGRAISVERRGRIYVLVWLRRGPSYLIGTQTATATVVVASADVLDDQTRGRP